MKQRPHRDFSSVEEILAYAMDEEEIARNYYKEASEYVTDIELKRFLLKLAHVETEHYEALKDMLDDYRAKEFGIRGILSSFDEVMR